MSEQGRANLLFVVSILQLSFVVLLGEVFLGVFQPSVLSLVLVLWAAALELLPSLSWMAVAELLKVLFGRRLGVTCLFCMLLGLVERLYSCSNCVAVIFLCILRRILGTFVCAAFCASRGLSDSRGRLFFAFSVRAFFDDVSLCGALLCAASPFAVVGVGIWRSSGASYHRALERRYLPRHGI